MNKWQENFYGNWASLRDWLFKPFSLTFTRLKISPNQITLAGVISMLLFAHFAPTNLDFAIYFILLAIVFDMFDGALARYQKIASDKGKLIDVSADCFNYFIFLLGLNQTGLVPTKTLLLLAFFMLLSRILRIFINSHKYKSNWLFRPVAGLLPNFISFSSYFIFITLAKINIEYINDLFYLFAIILVIDSGMHFYKITQVKYDS